MSPKPNALDLLDAWWAVPEAKRQEAMARLSALLEADEAQPVTPDGLPDAGPN